MHLNELQKNTVEVGTQVFGEVGMNSPQERLFRFAEEAFELMRAAGLTWTQVSRMATHEYFDRKKGEVSQEIAGVQCTLLSLAQVNGVDTEAVTLAELSRVLEKKDECRAKHAAKPLSMRAA